ncbi:MAG TPA: ATP-dependent protease LonB [Clostridiales bacterium]|jgi:Lon-like ATP-dependent protease|nr:ATP-dependent protease LonB [Clostridiales bacterium]
MQWIIFGLVQIIVMITVYSYFKWRKKKEEGQTKQIINREDTRELYELRAMRARSLNIPLSETVRPASLNDIIGQEEGIKALRAALCGANPQHVLIYGPPGVGKTCAARLILEEAKKRDISPFNQHSQFIEIDATCVRFDERSIADPLLGSVHDPIYQGAGALGVQGIPQPKPGAVSRAHCGVLFLDEIGELHPIQMNKLLKVLEDRCVHFESAYYSKHNTNIPQHIHDIFQKGLPADFRLVGATTRSPEELPPALRSRCVEIFFSPLTDEHLISIAKTAAAKLNIGINQSTLAECAAYSKSGRDAVNIIQLASSIAYEEGRSFISKSDVEWVANVCHLIKRHSSIIPSHSQVGVCYGLGVTGSVGSIIEIECIATKAISGTGTLNIRGAIMEEDFNTNGRRLKRKSMAYSSVENVCAAFYKVFGIDCRKYDIAFNIPGGMPMDGPSAGIALSTALMSALTGRAPQSSIALTGEVTVNGEVRAVGGIREKIQAAILAGAKKVIIPQANLEQAKGFDIQIIPVSNLHEVMAVGFKVSGLVNSSVSAGRTEQGVFTS